MRIPCLPSEKWHHTFSDLTGAALTSCRKRRDLRDPAFLFCLLEHCCGCGGLLLLRILSCGVCLYRKGDPEAYGNKERKAEKEARKRAEGAGLHTIIVPYTVGIHA